VKRPQRAKGCWGHFVRFSGSEQSRGDIWGHGARSGFAANSSSGGAGFDARTGVKRQMRVNQNFALGKTAGVTTQLGRAVGWLGEHLGSLGGKLRGAAGDVGAALGRGGAPLAARVEGLTASRNRLNLDLRMRDHLRT
jgi:hypothetical protein